MKANPGSGRIWNLIMYLAVLPPIGQESFAASRLYSLASAVDSDCSKTAPGQRTLLRQHSAVTAASSFQTSTDCWPFYKNAARNSVKVWARLL